MEERQGLEVKKLPRQGKTVLCPYIEVSKQSRTELLCVRDAWGLFLSEVGEAGAGDYILGYILQGVREPEGLNTAFKPICHHELKPSGIRNAFSITKLLPMFDARGIVIVVWRISIAVGAALHKHQWCLNIMSPCPSTATNLPLAHWSIKSRLEMTMDFVGRNSSFSPTSLEKGTETFWKHQWIWMSFLTSHLGCSPAGSEKYVYL